MEPWLTSGQIVQVPLTSKSASLDLPEGFGAAQWIKVNAGQYGFFRAAYDATSLQAVRAHSAQYLVVVLFFQQF